MVLYFFNFLDLVGRLEVSKDGFSRGYFERIGAVVLENSTSLDEKLLNLHVVNDSGITPGAFSKSTLLFPGGTHSHTTGEKGCSIRKELDLLKSIGSNGLVFGESTEVIKQS